MPLKPRRSELATQNYNVPKKGDITGAIAEKLTNSGLLEATTFPLALVCPELVIECANRYDPQNSCIRKTLGEILARIDRVIVIADLKIPHKEPY